MNTRLRNAVLVCILRVCFSLLNCNQSASLIARKVSKKTG